MKTCALLLGLFALGGSAYSTDFKGIRPHPNRADYSVTCFTEDIGVGATLVPSDEVRRLFGSEIDQNYIVVEVGFYSKNRSVFEVRHADFKLRNRPSRTLMQPADPRVILSSLPRRIEALVEK